MRIYRNSIILISNYFIFSMIVPFFLVLGTIIISLFQQRKLFYYFIILLLPFILISLFPLSIGFLNGNETKMIINHFRDYLIFSIILIYLTVITQYYKSNGAYLVYNSMVFMFVLISIIKVSILLSVFLFGFSTYEVFQYITESLNIAMMTYDTDNPYIFRIGFSFDAIIPFLIFFMIKEFKNTSNNRRMVLVVYIFLISFSLIVSMSRLFWIYALLLLLLIVLFYFKINGKVKFILFFVPSCILFLAFTNIGNQVLDIFDSRFGSSATLNNSNSDSIRVDQNYWILENFYQNPILGKGFGFYINGVIRDINNKYIYESQNLSLLMDFGIFIFILFYFLLLYYVFKFNLRGLKNICFALIFFILWIISGSLNPFLLGNAGAIILYFSINYSKLNDTFIHR